QFPPVTVRRRRPVVTTFHKPLFLWKHREQSGPKKAQRNSDAYASGETMGQPRNIFVAFELLHPERGDERIAQTIEGFGCAWARVNKTTFYIHGDFDAQYVGNKVWAAMNMDDKL